MRQSLFQRLANRIRHLRVHLSDNQTMVLLITVVLLVLTNLAVLLILVVPQSKSPSSLTIVQESREPLQPVEQTPTPDQIQGNIQDQSEVFPVQSLSSGSTIQGTIIFSMTENGYRHLFAFSPGNPNLVRLTDGSWDDTSPVMDPTGRMIAFSSQRNGYWDIYLLDLQTGVITPITDTSDFDTHPTWSPDGSKIAFQSYIDENSEIIVVDLQKQPFELNRITINDYDDYDPDWSPDGENLVFISAYDNKPALWNARFVDSQIQIEPISVKSGYDPRNPTWSPDGSSISWSEMISGRRTILTWQYGVPSQRPIQATEGDFPAWSKDGKILFFIIQNPNKTYLSAISYPDGNLVYPVTPTAGMVSDLHWSTNQLPAELPAWFGNLQTATLPALYQLAITPPAANLPNRYQVVTIPDVKAPYTLLHDLTDESFVALRERLKLETGWDVLANLENAFIPITEVADPNMQENWLYTGRAFSLNTIPMNINWMFISRETFGDQTYFRMFVRPVYQDGSMGKPIFEKSWDINARFSSDPSAYENGGIETDSYPDGYWVDLTDLALRFGWERIEASPNWTNYYPGARFNLFALRSGLSWKDAMLELYPQDAFITPTPLAAPTITLTPTRRLFKTLTPTITPSPTSTSTRRPTWTPFPNQ